MFVGLWLLCYAVTATPKKEEIHSSYFHIYKRLAYLTRIYMSDNESVSVSNGVKQGGVLSSVFFYNLSVELHDCKSGWTEFKLLVNDSIHADVVSKVKYLSHILGSDLCDVDTKRHLCQLYMPANMLAQTMLLFSLFEPIVILFIRLTCGAIIVKL